MNSRTYCLVSGVLFTLVALAHLWRIIGDIPVTLGGDSVPMAASWFGLVVPGLLAVWAFRCASSARPTP